jgi:hypothetical protein
MTDKKTEFKTCAELLGYVQANIKAPKTRENKFAGYKFRNCEDIFNAVKPYLLGGSCLTVNDEIVLIGDRYYVKATATFRFAGDAITNVAYAREPLQKKGSDESQITGATSSYARKYALNGLLLIDDTQDADETNDHKDAPKEDKEAKKKQYDMVNQINACRDTAQLVAWQTDNEKAIEALPEEYASSVMSQYENALQQRQNGIQGGAYKFLDTKEMNAWMLEVKPQIEACDTISELAQWEETNKPKLIALDAGRKTRMRELITAQMQRIEFSSKDMTAGG